MRSVKEFVKNYETRLKSVDKVTNLLEALSHELNLLHKIRSQAASMGLRKLSAIEGMRQILSLNEEELLDVEKTSEVYNLVNEICKDAILEVLSKIVGNKIKAQVTNCEELYPMFNDFVDLYRNLKHKEVIKEIIAYNVSVTDAKLEDVIRVKEQLLNVDKALDEIASIDSQIIGVDLHVFVKSKFKEVSFKELEKLISLANLLKDLAKIRKPIRINCEEFSSIIVKKWCNEYNELIDKLENRLNDVKTMLQEFDISKLEKIKEKYSETKESLEYIDFYKNEVFNKAERILKEKLVPLREINDVLRCTDEHVKHEHLEQLHQLILGMLASEGTMEISKLIKNLQKVSQRSHEEILRAVYDLCTRGIITCIVQL